MIVSHFPLTEAFFTMACGVNIFSGSQYRTVVFINPVVFINRQLLLLKVTENKSKSKPLNVQVLAQGSSIGFAKVLEFSGTLVILLFLLRNLNHLLIQAWIFVFWEVYLLLHEL